MINHFLTVYKLIYLFIYSRLRWVFVAAGGLSLVVASGGYSSLWCTGFLLRLTGSVAVACVLSSCGSRAPECRLSSCGTLG